MPRCSQQVLTAASERQPYPRNCQKLAFQSCSGGLCQVHKLEECGPSTVVIVITGRAWVCNVRTTNDTTNTNNRRPCLAWPETPGRTAPLSWSEVVEVA